MHIKYWLLKMFKQHPGWICQPLYIIGCAYFGLFMVLVFAYLICAGGGHVGMPSVYDGTFGDFIGACILLGPAHITAAIALEANIYRKQGPDKDELEIENTTPFGEPLEPFREQRQEKRKAFESNNPHLFR